MARENSRRNSRSSPSGATAPLRLAPATRHSRTPRAHKGIPPILKDFNGRGTRNPLYRQNRNVRIYPYGKMAYRSIGRVNENQKTREIHGYSGLEMALDLASLRQTGPRQARGHDQRNIQLVTTLPRRGYADIHTTINIDLQEML